MMLIQQQKETTKNLDFHILNYTYHNMNIPFDCKTICFAIKELKYQKNYVAMTLSKMVKIRYLTEPQSGIYVMTSGSYEIIKTINPEFAKEIKSKLMYVKSANCQKST